MLAEKHKTNLKEVLSQCMAIREYCSFHANQSTQEDYVILRNIKFKKKI